MKLVLKRKPIVSVKDKKRFCYLSFFILRQKCLYYLLPGDTSFDHFRIDDDEFDAIVKEYKKLAKKLNEKPTASKQVGYDKFKPSSVLALTKLLLDRFNYQQQKKDRKNAKWKQN